MAARTKKRCGIIIGVILAVILMAFINNMCSKITMPIEDNDGIPVDTTTTIIEDIIEF